MSRITENRLEEDNQIYERMRELNIEICQANDGVWKESLERELKHLHWRYYCENDDIRLYYKTM